MSKYDKEKHAVYRKKQAHKMGGYQVEYRARRRRLIHEMKKSLSCVYCGYSNPLCIDFDHIDHSTKKAVPATMITGGYKWEDVLEEIAKCQPVCANCHRMKTILESDKMKAIEEDILQYIPLKMLEEFSPLTCPKRSSKVLLEDEENTSNHSS